MPFRKSKKYDGETVVLCINCEDNRLTLDHGACTLRAGKAKVQVFAVFCDRCGYTELYRDGYFFQTGDA